MFFLKILSKTAIGIFLLAAKFITKAVKTN